MKNLLLVAAFSSMTLSSAESCHYGCKGTVTTDPSWGEGYLQCSGGISPFPDNNVPDGYTGFCRDDIRSLFLNANQLTTLPAEVFDGLPNLSTLSLQQNQLTNLPDAVFNNLSKLWGLWLSGNEQVVITREMVENLSSSIGALDLSYTGLTWIPQGWFNHFSNLQRLELGGNNISMYPACLFNHLPSDCEIGLDAAPSACPAGSTMQASSGNIPAHCVDDGTSCSSIVVLPTTDPCCSFCHPGMAPSPDNTSCSLCSPGTYSSDGTKCFECREGFYSQAGAASCNICPAGTSSSDGIQCIPSGSDSSVKLTTDAAGQDTTATGSFMFWSFCLGACLIAGALFTYYRTKKGVSTDIQAPMLV